MPNIVNGLGQVKVGVRISSGGGGGIDTDAQAFITAANITDTTQQNAIIKLVTDLKGYGVWTKMKALYPFVGGTASQHRFNLINPALFKIDWYGGGTHGPNGYQPNGGSYGDTNFNPSTGYIVNNSAHISYYSRTNSSEVYDTEMGCYDVNNLVITIRRSDQSNNTFLFANTNNGINFADSDSLGLYVSNRINNQANGFKNGVSKGSNTVTDNARNNKTITIGALNATGFNITQYSSRESAFASIGDGLTDTEAANFYTAVQTFQTTLGRQVGVPIVADADAQAFLNAAVITNQTQANAINTLVTSLKSANIWTKMRAIYPFVGGTASSHKFNLKDPRDLDAAYRLVFNGGWTHSTTGALPNGSNGYADTKLIPSSAISNQSSAHLSFYSNTNSFPTVNGTIKANGGYTFPPLKGLQIGYWKRGSGQNTYYFQIGGGTEILVDTATPTSQGFLLGSRTSSTAAKLYQNNTTLGSSSTLTTDGLSSAVTYLGARNGNSVIEQYHNLNHQFTSIGDGLTDAEATAFYNAVQAYQTTLGRQV